MNHPQNRQKQLDNVSPITTQHHNLFKHKNRSESQVQNKTNSTFQNQFKPNLKMKNTDRSQVEEGNLLIQKKGAGNANGEHQSNLRNVIQEEENKLIKPFSKKYISSKNIPSKPQQNQQETPQKQDLESKGPTSDKNKTKESFNKRLSNNIIKDEQNQSTKTKAKVQIESRSPKIVKKELISINGQEDSIQQEILELHKKNKEYLRDVMEKYRLSFKREGKYGGISDSHEGEERENQALRGLQLKLNENRLKIGKIQQTIDGNQYMMYFRTLPEDIQEQQVSEEEDSVDELPIPQPKFQTNIGSYSTAMSQVKDKKFGLNARRTYDYFKENLKESKITTITTKEKQRQPQPVPEQLKTNDGQNRLTINNKFKDFLLN